VVKRDGAEKSLTLALTPNWRRKADISRRVGTWPMRGMTSGGMVLLDLTDEERTQRKLPQNNMALYVKSVGQYGKHAAAKKAGFQKDDVILQLAGVNTRVTEGELIGYLLQKYPMGTTVKATVLRGNQRVELNLPMQ